MTRCATVAALGLAVIVAAVGGLQGAAAAAPSTSPNASFVPGEILLQFRASATPEVQQAIRELVGAARKRLVRVGSEGRLELATLPAAVPIERAVELLRQHPAVTFAEPNWIYTHEATSNDTYYTNGSLWGMYGDDTPDGAGLSGTTNPYGGQAEDAWRRGFIGSGGVYVGVIDEGIDFDHPDLNDNIWTNPYDPVDGSDNDGNGYVDDIHGWDFFQNNNSVYDGGPGDSATDSHGTHVSGTLGGEGGNGAGVAGVNWDVTIISGKFLGPSGGTTVDAVEAVDYFTDLKKRHGLNIVATNNSWGGGGYSQALHAAIIRAAKEGILTVAAAGNGIQGVPRNNDQFPHYPSSYTTAQAAGSEAAASYDGVIAVTSLTSTGAKSNWANYGAVSVDLGAPGSGVWSTTPNGGYSSYSGTSMATPHVSGAIALYAAMNPGTTAPALKQAIMNSAAATPTSSLGGVTVTGGRLNISLFAGGQPPPPPEPPAAPSGLAASAASSSQINLSWTDNASNETGFKIERCQGTACTSFAEIAQVSANLTSYGNTGLAANTTYRYRVRAYGSAGDSAYSNAAEAATQAGPAPPAPPSNLTATTESRTRIKLAWQDNSGNETGFRIERCTGQSCTDFQQVKTVSGGTTSWPDKNRTRNTWYRYRVLAYSAVGNSSYSNLASAKTNA